VTVEGRAIDRKGAADAQLVRTWGSGAAGREQLAIFGTSAVGLEQGKLGPLRAAELFAEQRLKKASPALRSALLARASAVVGDGQLRAFAPGPFDAEWSKGLGGLLAATTAIGIAVRFPSPTPSPTPTPNPTPNPTPTPSPSPSPTPSPSPSPTPGVSPVWFFTGVGITAALGAVTLLSGLDTTRKHDDYFHQNCDRFTSSACASASDAGISAQHRTNIFLGVTAVAAAGTAVLGLFFVRWKTSVSATVVGSAPMAQLRVALP
jgi:hypothetical protein